MATKDITAVLILAPWGSGSTAVTSFLDGCGAFTCPPHFFTNDPRTPNAYEPAQYRRSLLELFDENTLKQVGQPADFVAFFSEWWADQCDAASAAGHSHIALKVPLQTLVLPHLHKMLDPKIICVTRPLRDIERTRQRRSWPPVFGAAGARALYQAAAQYLTEHNVPYLSVPFQIFRSDADLRKETLDYIGLNPKPKALREAEKRLRPAPAPKSG